MPPDIELRPVELEQLISFRRHYVSCARASQLFIPLRPYLRTRTDQVGLWVLAGQDKTSDQGEASFSINEMLSVEAAATPQVSPLATLPRITDVPALLIATPAGNTPVFLSADFDSRASELATPLDYYFTDLVDGHIIQNSQNAVFDVNIKVKTWSRDGNAASNVAFSWVCVVEGALLCVSPG